MGTSRRWVGLAVAAVLAAAALGGCASAGGPSAPGTAATPGATGGAAPGASTAVAPGTITVTVGIVTRTYKLTECADTSQGVIVTAGDAKTEGVHAVLDKAGGSMPSISGALAGRAWFISPLDAATRTDGKSGTFSGADGLSHELVKGAFACG